MGNSGRHWWPRLKPHLHLGRLPLVYEIARKSLLRVFGVYAASSACAVLDGAIFCEEALRRRRPSEFFVLCELPFQVAFTGIPGGHAHAEGHETERRNQ